MQNLLNFNKFLFPGDTDSLSILRGDLNSEGEIRRWNTLPGYEMW